MGKVYHNPNQEMLEELLKYYQIDTLDWLSYPITKKNILTLHHIIKAADGGPLTIGNSAILTKSSHRALHICEARDFILYSEINAFFKAIIAYRLAMEDQLAKMALNDEFRKESKGYKLALTRTLYK